MIDNAITYMGIDVFCWTMTTLSLSLLFSAYFVENICTKIGINTSLLSIRYGLPLFDTYGNFYDRYSAVIELFFSY